MIYTIKNKVLQVKVELSLNLLTRRSIEKLADDAEHVIIDLSTTKIVDSEGVILLWQLNKKNKNVSLIKPPAILFDIVDILGLSNEIRIQQIAKDH